MENRALIFDIKRDCSEDGPGIRTTVFFKGCPLSCTWCQNPEGKEKHLQISFDANRCKPELCNTACINVCEAHCLSFVDKLHVNHDQCTRCDHCFDVCPTKALEPVGYWITLDDLLYRILIDEPFFQSSGGGVTLSGGEVTQQMPFIHQLLKALKTRGIHTAIETSGFFNYRKFQQLVLPWLDLIYFDLKLIDEEQSREFTGQGNHLILENFNRLIEQDDVAVIPRIPLIPNITATEKNLSGIAHLLNKLHVSGATLLPYNPLWQDKLKKLDLNPRYLRKTLMNSDEKNLCVDNFYAGATEVK